MKKLLIKGAGHQKQNRDTAVAHFLEHFDAESLKDGFVSYQENHWRVTANTDTKKVMVKNTSPEERDGGVRDIDIHEYIYGHIMYRQMSDDRVVVYFVTRLDELGEATDGKAFLLWDELKNLSDSSKVFRIE